MCGIFGIVNLDGRKGFNKELVLDSINTMKHRGPDASDYKILDERVCLGHLRLAIIDVKPESNQPFCIDDRYWIVYNGEIYNYIELRSELRENYNILFVTESDTEVLLRAYQFWGEECVNRFNGMWAFAIYDVKENKLFCSRDRFGVKPFNYSIVNGHFVFASEIKAILEYFPELKVPNFNVIANFCRSSVGAQHRETWFENVFRLEPSYNMVITTEEIRRYRYWNYPTKVNKSLSFDNAIEKYREIFSDAVKLRMRSDVPIGTTLSSGVDSNSIVYSLREYFKSEHHTYTAAFNSDQYDALDKQAYAVNDLEIDEAHIVRSSVKNLDLSSHFIDVDYNNFIPDLQKIIFHLESGNSSPAVFPLMQVMERANKEVTVVLEGQGADELLGGYQQTLFIAIVIEHIKSFELKKAYLTIVKTIRAYSFSYAAMLYFRQLSNKYPIISSIYQSITGIDKVFTTKLAINKKMKDYPETTVPKFDSIINEELYHQHTGGLANLLHYGDAISMAHSLESRLPFMDYRLVEFAFTLPWQFKIHQEFGKYIHRKAMKGLVPDSILDSILKFGFTTPISQFFKLSNNLNIKPKDILLSKKSLERGLFRQSGLIKLFDEHEKSLKNHSTLLYRLLCVELWFREFIDDKQ
jgi:asparagine synthase (glutamine-hydrolysing)